MKRLFGLATLLAILLSVAIVAGAPPASAAENCTQPGQGAPSTWLADRFRDAYNEAPQYIGSPVPGSNGCVHAWGTVWTQDFTSASGKTLLMYQSANDRVYRLFGDWLRKYEERGGVNEFGAPEDNAHEAGPGHEQYFRGGGTGRAGFYRRGGVGVQVYVVQGAILERFVREGGVGGRLGSPASYEQAVTSGHVSPDGARKSGVLHVFENGAIAHYEGKTIVVWGAIDDEYYLVNESVPGRLGFPVAEEEGVTSGYAAPGQAAKTGRIQVFENGAITFYDGKRFTTWGAIDREYYAVNRSVPGRLGFPTRQEEGVTSGATGKVGKIQVFENGAITYYDAKTFTTWGAVDDEYLLVNRSVPGRLGFPTKQEEAVTSGASGKVGRIQVFEKGAITLYDGKRFTTWGAIDREYYAVNGSVPGRLGFPTRQEEKVSSGYAPGDVRKTGTNQVFENGVITYYENKTFTVWGAVDDEYYLVNRGVAGRLGFPTKQEERVASGYAPNGVRKVGSIQVFENGAIVYYEGKRFTTWGRVDDEYYGTNGSVPGRLGFPTRQEAAVTSGATRKAGSIQVFENGAITLNGSGTYSTFGKIDDKWYALGTAPGRMGLPRTDDTPTTYGARVLFEGGTIVFCNGNGLAFELPAGGQPCAGIPAGVPSPPEKPFLRSTTESSISISWKDSQNESWYEIRRNRVGGSTFEFFPKAGQNITTQLHSSLGQGAGYQYQVRACNAAGCSAYSPPLSAWARRQWDDARNFTGLDYGLYWFRCGACRQDALSENGRYESDGQAAAGPMQNDEYYNPSRPTVIYVHGWQKDGGGKRRESMERNGWVLGDDTRDGEDVMASWRLAGWNVGVFYWNQFADDDLGLSWAAVLGGVFPDVTEAKIWTYNGPQEMRWRDSSGAHHSFGQRRSVSDLFLEAYRYNLAGNTSRDIRIVGHSLGNQLAVKLAMDLDASAPALRPQRVALIDPYWSKTERGYLGGETTWGRVGRFVGELKSRVRFEYYQTSELAGHRVRSVADQMVFSRIYPAFLVRFSPDYRVHVEDETAQHNYAPYWYFMSRTAPFAPSALTSNAYITELMGGGYWWQQDPTRGGIWTPNPRDDEFLQWPK